jgi:hypothetical protein
MKNQIADELSGEPPFMTVLRVSALLDVSESTIRRYVRRGELIAIASDGPNSAQANKGAEVEPPKQN